MYDENLFDNVTKNVCMGCGGIIIPLMVEDVGKRDDTNGAYVVYHEQPISYQKEEPFTGEKTTWYGKLGVCSCCGRTQIIPEEKPDDLVQQELDKSDSVDAEVQSNDEEPKSFSISTSGPWTVDEIEGAIRTDKALIPSEEFVLTTDTNTEYLFGYIVMSMLIFRKAWVNALNRFDEQVIIDGVAVFFGLNIGDMNRGFASLLWEQWIQFLSDIEVVTISESWIIPSTYDDSRFNEYLAKARFDLPVDIAVARLHYDFKYDVYSIQKGSRS